MKHLSVLVFILLFIACTDNNPTNFFDANSSSETPLSSSVSVESSSSLDILSSSFEIESSSSELSSSSMPISYGTLTDERDGQVYKTVKIGNQTWMAENLNYAYLKPFDDQDSSSWCYNNDPEKCAKYGRLYTWAAAVDSLSWTFDWTTCVDYDDAQNFSIRGVCPENWHVPSVIEWDSLLNMTEDIAVNLKATEGWFNKGNGTDVFGFSVLPDETGKQTCFWTPLETTTLLDVACLLRSFPLAYIFKFTYYDSDVEFTDIEKKRYACSVRCIKDNESAE